MAQEFIMPNSASRWFSTILLNYNLRDSFWDRDAGLFYQGLRDLGIDARFSLIGSPDTERHPDLVLAPLADLQNSNWWRQWELEGVILYSWGLPKFTPVAKAIKAAGLRLVLIMDTGGYISPRVWPWMFWRLKRIVEKQQNPVFPGLRAFAKSLAAWPRLKQQGLFEHLKHADLLVFPSTLGKERYAGFLRSSGLKDVAARCVVVPHPVSDKMVFDPKTQKERQIIAVGGWARVVKNAPGLVSTLAKVLDVVPNYSAQVVGTGDHLLQELVSKLPSPVRHRIQIIGPVPNEQLPGYYQRSRISICTSFSESFHIATGEALCCGCSFVGDARISSMPYFASLGGSGTVSCDLSPKHLSQAVLAEIDLWEAGFRDPAAISATWTGLLHPANVVRRLLSFFPAFPSEPGSHHGPSPSPKHLR